MTNPPASLGRDIPETADITRPPPPHLNWILPSIFWIPGWDFASARAEHLPFYFWLVDTTRPGVIVDLVTGKPDNYLAFCQSIDRLGYDAECFGAAGVFDHNRSPLRKYHDIHFRHLSHLADETKQLFQLLGDRTIDLLHIDGQQASEFSELDVRSWLKRLSPQGLILVEKPEYLGNAWLGLLEKRVSLVIKGTDNLKLSAADTMNGSMLGRLFGENDDATATTSMRAIFARFGFALREHALHRDLVSFSAKLEISLADQSAIADRLREENASLKADVGRQTLEQTGLVTRIAYLEPYIKELRNEVIRHRDRVVLLENVSRKFERAIEARDLEIEALGAQVQVLSHQGEAEISRLSQLTVDRESELLAATQHVRLQQEAAERREAVLLGTLHESDTRLSELRSHALRLESDLAEITQSTAWELTKPFRLFFANFPKTARALRRVFEFLWWTVSFQLFSRLKQLRRSRQDSKATLINAPTTQLSDEVTAAPSSDLSLPVTPARAADSAIGPDHASSDEDPVAQVCDEARAELPTGLSSPPGAPALAADSVSEIEQTSSDNAYVTRAFDELTAAPSADLSLPPVAHAQAADSVTQAEHTPDRIRDIEARIVEMASVLDTERRRIDFALLGTEGLLDEIELFHEARARSDYKKVFTDESPLVSICVATMNRSDLLIERCLKSLICQSYRNIQINVVGDHCTDDTGSRIADLRDDRISFTNLPSRGPYPPPGIDRWRVAGTNAFNVALSMCEGQFITHLDDDDSATNDRIEMLVNAAQERKADFCWHPFWCEHKDGSWYLLGNGRFELGQITTGSIFYHQYFKKFPWDVFAYRTEEPGDWNRLRKIRSLRPNLHFVDRSLMFHYIEGSQVPFSRRNGESFLE